MIQRICFDVTTKSRRDFNIKGRKNMRISVNSIYYLELE